MEKKKNAPIVSVSISEFKHTHKHPKLGKLNFFVNPHTRHYIMFGFKPICGTERTPCTNVYFSINMLRPLVSFDIFQTFGEQMKKIQTEPYIEINIREHVAINFFNLIDALNFPCKIECYCNSIVSDNLLE
jgi:hypothetical protein